MMDIAKRAQQASTSKRDFEQLRANEKKHRRGGAPGDVVALGKRKAPEPDSQPSMLRKAKGAPAASSRQRIYGPKTQVFDLDREPIRVY
jgi:hypothetical protein